MAYHRLMRQLASIERDGAKPDGLTQTIEIASKHRERQRGDMELFRQLDYRQTNRWTDRYWASK